MSPPNIVRVASLKDVPRFREHLNSLGLTIPCDDDVLRGSDSPLAQPWADQHFNISNRIAVQPMEGWDGAPDGNPTESTLRRWRRFGKSGGKLIWGGEAVAVCARGRANPNQLVIAEHTQRGLANLRAALVEEHRATTGSNRGLLIGLQLTHSGRFCRPRQFDRAEPLIVYRHPILDRRFDLRADHPVLSDGEIEAIIDDFPRAARIARELGFDFVDVKHCHGYLGHEFLSAHTREGKYGGSFENRTRFLREVVRGIRSVAPGLQIGVRVSAFDTVPFRAGPENSAPGKPGTGIPELQNAMPYQWGFGLDSRDPTHINLDEPMQFLALLEALGITLVNISAGSPYYNPHIQRPALFPPSDGYQPPEDPLVGVARLMHAARQLKQRFPKLLIVGSGYSYLQEFLPHVTQAAVREGWVDFVGLGRMALSYPELLWDALNGNCMQRNRVCRTFSDCTTAPRNGLPSGCYPLDDYYKNSEHADDLKRAKLVQVQAAR